MIAVRSPWESDVPIRTSELRDSLVLASVVCLAYYVGSMVGLQLRLPPATPSVLWPPNAILTTALLFTPPRRWVLVLLAVLPAHLWLQLGTFPAPLVFAFFLTNCSEALLAATTIRYFSDEPTRFDTLRRVTIFLCGGVLFAPAVSSFLDAAAVATLRGDPYWEVWQTRTLANMLTAMAIIPAAAGLLHAWAGTLRWPRRRMRDTEIAAALLAFAILGATGHVGWLELSRLPISVFMPFLMWMAVRFGATGAGSSLFIAVIVIVGFALTDGGTLGTLPTTDRVPIIQLFMIVTAVPLLCVAGLIEERRVSETALRDANLMSAAILASLPSEVVVLDRHGRIIAVNEGGHLTGSHHRIFPPGTSRAGHSFFLEAPVGHGRDSLDGVRAVLDRRQPFSAGEYVKSTANGERWFTLSAVPLRRPEGGAVVTYTDITEQRRAEFAAQQSRNELAHVTRVWVLGELTASLSHQLHQPLTAIAGNAEAGKQYLKRTPPDLTELRHIFDDIVADAARASDVIIGVREMLRKDAGTRAPEDINELVRQTLRLVASESLIREVSIEAELAPALPALRLNRVQVQQVILNLLVNGLEAVGGQHGIVTIRTSRNTDHVEVSVLDTGAGLAPGADKQVFEPFYTTKKSGMGMGLAIARAIIEAHGGTIWAHNRAQGGAAFRIKLPIDETGHTPAP